MTWYITRNGVIPPLATRPTFEEAVTLVSNITGETPANIKVNHGTGCPTMDTGGRSSRPDEYDIEEVS